MHDNNSLTLMDRASATSLKISLSDTGNITAKYRNSLIRVSIFTPNIDLMTLNTSGRACYNNFDNLSRRINANFKNTIEYKPNIRDVSDDIISNFHKRLICSRTEKILKRSFTQFIDSDDN